MVLVASDAIGKSEDGTAAGLPVAGAVVDGGTAVVLLGLCARAPSAVKASVSAERAMIFKVESSCLGSSRSMGMMHADYNERGPARLVVERARGLLSREA